MTSLIFEALPTIRTLLRDTALEVSLLAQKASPSTIQQLRHDCLQLISALEHALEQQKTANDVIQDAIYAQCALLDETVLRNLPESAKSEWEAEPLQVQRFQNHDAGQRIYERIHFRLRETKPNVQLLQCYSTVLGLGFKGRYVLNEDKDRIALMAELDTQISQMIQQPEQKLMINSTRSRRIIMDWFYRLSPWALAGLSAVLTLALYAVLGQSLDLQLSQLMLQKPQ